MIEALKICDEVYFHLIEMNFKFYKELYNSLTEERAVKAIVDAQLELQKMINDRYLNNYHERIKRNAV